MKQAVVAALNRILDDPGLVHISPTLRPAPLTVTKLQNEVNHELSKARPDISRTRELLLLLAVEKYASCVDAKADLAFRAIFENHEPAAAFDRGLFDATVQKVSIAGTGNLFLHLKNGQVLPEPDQP
jgi:hypothetical protein